MIETRVVAELEVSAASGLAACAGQLLVIADDAVRLAVYEADGAPARMVKLFDEQLPDEPHARKAAKPDLESLASLPGDLFLALGSGSRATRMRGATIRPLDGWAVRTVDLGSFYEALSRRVPELNIEGAAVCGEWLRLLQRGNGKTRIDAVIDLDLAGVMRSLADGRPLEGDLIRDVRRVDLGSIGGVRLRFTDAATAPDGTFLFSAAAEDSIDAYEDGPCVGSAIGRLSPDGRVLSCGQIDRPLKIEGLCVVNSSQGSYDLRLVADADDPTVRSPLLACVL